MLQPLSLKLCDDGPPGDAEVCQQQVPRLMESPAPVYAALCCILLPSRIHNKSIIVYKPNKAPSRVCRQVSVTIEKQEGAPPLLRMSSVKQFT